MPDIVKRYIHTEGQFKVVIAETSNLGRAFFAQQSPAPLTLHLMTQAMTGAVLLAASLKGEGSLMLKLRGDGPTGHLTVEANSLGHVRGFAGNPSVDYEEQSGKGFLQYAVGAGELTVVRRSLPSGKLFQSVVPLGDGEMALNLTRYLLQSEQVPSAMQLGISLDPDQGVAGAGGILLQALPDANEHLLFILEDRVSQLASLGPLFTLPNGHERIVAELFEGIELKPLVAAEVTLQCSCTRDRVLRTLAALPRADLVSMRDGGPPLEMSCSFCAQTYQFSQEDLSAVLDHEQASRSS